ncbi:MAG TPA: sialidase family protein [Planctomycetota bacterium]|nr:sialidase family protein [Planctomycetota bacterium]
MARVRLALPSVLLVSGLLAGAPRSAAGEETKPSEPHVTVADDAIQPQVALDEDGGVYVVFIREGNIEVSVSTDRGKTFGRPRVAIDTGGKAGGGMQRGPRIGVGDKKTLIVTAPLTFDNSEFEKKYPTSELFLVSSSDGGATWTRPIQVNEAAKKAPEALHWLAVAPGGSAHIAWLDLRGRRTPGQDLYYSRFVDGKLSPNVRVAQQVCECCAPGLAVGADGAPVVAWREGGSVTQSRELWITSARDPGAFAAPQRLNQAATQLQICPMSAPAVAASADGKKVAAAWMDERSGKKERRLHWAVAEAMNFTSDTPIEPDRKVLQDHPALAFDAAGTLWAAWEENDRSSPQTIRAAQLGKVGASVASDAALGPASFPSVASRARGGVVVVYEAGKKGDSIAVFHRLQ